MLLLLLPAGAHDDGRVFCKPRNQFLQVSPAGPLFSHGTGTRIGGWSQKRSGVCVLPPAALTFFPPARAFVRLVWRTAADCTAQQPYRSFASQAEAHEAWRSSASRGPGVKAPCLRRSAARAANAAIEVGWDGTFAALRVICACRHNCVYKKHRPMHQTRGSVINCSRKTIFYKSFKLRRLDA